MPCWTTSDKSPAVCTSLSKCLLHIMNAIMSSQFWRTQCSSLLIGTVGFLNALLMYGLNSKSFSGNGYSECHNKWFVIPSRSNLKSLAWNSWAIRNCCVYVMIYCISSFTNLQNISSAVAQPYSHSVDRDSSFAFETLIQEPTSACNTSSKVSNIRLGFHWVVSTSFCISSNSIANLLDSFST